LKNRIIISILAKITQIKEDLNINKSNLEIGSRLNYVNKNKSSEVFKVKLNQNSLTKKEKIEKVNNSIGKIIDDIIKNYYLEEIKELDFK